MSDELWATVKQRRDGVRATLQKSGAFGRSRAQAHDVESKYLLAGFARCAVCGGALGVLSLRRTGTARRFVYGCMIHNKRGPNVCSNALVKPMDRVDAAVLDKLMGDALRPAVIDALVAGLLDALQSKSQAMALDGQRLELRQIDRELARLTDAVASGGGSIGSLLDGLKARQAVDGPWRFTPKDGEYVFEGEVAIGRLLSEIPARSDDSTSLASPPRHDRRYRLYFEEPLPRQRRPMKGGQR